MSGAAAIAVQDLSFTYRGAARRALDGVDLDLAPGRWHLLLGPTGAGKSSLVRCLNRAIPQFYPGELRGRIVVDGREVAGRRVVEMARHLGVVFQEFESQIFSTSCFLEVAFAMENRCVPPGEIRRRVPGLLARVGLAGFETRDPATLSGGEKQRLVIAAVMALDAPVLALDEPASDLDPGGRDDVYRLFTGCETVLLVEHDLEGLPSWASGALLSAGRVTRRWREASVETIVELTRDLGAAGVRAPPIASLASHLRDAAGLAGLPPPRLVSLEPETFHAALREGGWRVAAPECSCRAPSAPAAPEILRCERLTHVFQAPRGGRRALDGIDLSIRQGEMVALIGANGSGKTTLARHMNGLLHPTEGRVLYRGEQVGGIPARRRAMEIGFVFQNPDHQIFAPTVREEAEFGPLNIGLTREEARRRASAALDAVGLTGEEQTDPFSMTKGARQRLALASVLACEPRLIIMDEPTTGLDLAQQESVMGLLERLNARGHTILIITHALWLVSPPVRRALVMIDGRLAADGPPGDLLTDEALMTRAGLRMPDLARLARLSGVPLLTLEAWRSALVPPAAARGRG